MIYVKFDNLHKERQQLTKEFNEEFPGLEASVGGETGIDIYEKGHNKAQLLSYLEEVEEIHFFGDAIYEGGNDWPLAKAITARNHSQDSVYRVDGWQATYDILKRISN